ncbi:hypothetical protein [Amphritea pacifica]|uniref:Uncharacterized protein n=1 Tax=Amphritea pacifica TaxID=2811233 RepID=A0ABS2WDU1_9GAMM|nr:hypothetical protein [Amphritea pacifica]MBN0989864.1 hypothetical protein [Amphritea pacifica]
MDNWVENYRFAAVKKCIEPNPEELRAFKGWFIVTYSNASMDLWLQQRDITNTEMEAFFNADRELARQTVNRAFEETGCQAKEIQRSIDFFHKKANARK